MMNNGIKSPVLATFVCALTFWGGATPAASHLNRGVCGQNPPGIMPALILSARATSSHLAFSGAMIPNDLIKSPNQIPQALPHQLQDRAHVLEKKHGPVAGTSKPHPPSPPGPWQGPPCMRRSLGPGTGGLGHPQRRVMSPTPPAHFFLLNLLF